MTVLKEIITNSPEETEAVGFELAQEIEKNLSLHPFIALYGDLGVGKTAFVRGFTKVFSPAALVRSPTFALVNEYPTKGNRRVFHFDMYRITDEDDLYSIGYYDYLDDGSICLVEWSENIPYALPDDHLRLTIEKCGVDTPDHRQITLTRITGGQ
jgi:tRNA threonylcarbamoyladenosine biosynthesis protein TsaE